MTRLDFAERTRPVSSVKAHLGATALWLLEMVVQHGSTDIWRERCRLPVRCTRKKSSDCSEKPEDAQIGSLARYNIVVRQHSNMERGWKHPSLYPMF